MLEHELYEIERCDGSGFTLRLLPGSAIYEGHFPGNPVTPGVCQVGIVQELLQRLRGVLLTLREVKNLKFVDVLRPEPDVFPTVLFDLVIENGNLLSVKGLIGVGERVLTKFSLVFGKES